MGGRLVVTGYGAGATAALRALVAEAKDGDVLAPVDVVVPSAFAGMTVRRALAGEAGIVNVRFNSLPQLAERLAARAMALRGKVLLGDGVRTTAIATAAAAVPGPMSGVATAPRTAGLVHRLVSELDEVGVAPERLVALRAESDRGRHVADLYTAYRQHLGDAADAARVLRAAVSAVLTCEAPATHVVLFAPRRASAVELELLAALAERSRLSGVLCLTGETHADADVDALQQRLHGPASRARGRLRSPDRLSTASSLRTPRRRCAWRCAAC